MPLDLFFPVLSAIPKNSKMTFGVQCGFCVGSSRKLTRPTACTAAAAQTLSLPVDRGGGAFSGQSAHNVVNHLPIFFIQVAGTESVDECCDASKFLCHGFGNTFGRGHVGGEVILKGNEGQSESRNINLLKSSHVATVYFVGATERMTF